MNQLNQKDIFLIPGALNRPANTTHPRKKKTRSNESDLAYTLRPLYFFSRVFGLMPFSVVRSPNSDFQEVRVSILDGFWFVTSVGFYLLAAFICYRNMELPQDQSQSYILLIGDALLLITGLIYGAVTIVVDMLNRFRLVEILRMFIAFDKEVEKLGPYLDYKKKFLRVIFWLIGTTVVSLILGISVFIASKHNYVHKPMLFCVIYFIANQYQHFVVAAILTTYFMLIFTLHHRFETLNALLKKQFLNKNMAWTSGNTHKRESITLIKFIGCQHDLLTEIMDKINVCYSIQVMINIGASFVFSVLTFYSFYRYILQQNEFFGKIAYVHINYQIFYMTYTNMVVYAGSIIARKGSETARLVHVIINSIDDLDIASSLNRLSLQIQHRHPVATCGLFVFDWSLIYNIVGSIITYIVVLVNFETATKT